MTAIGKIVKTRKGEAVQLPPEFQFDCSEVWIQRDPRTFNLILTAKPDTWREFFELAEQTVIPASFMAFCETEPETEGEQT
jgi:virulence-associated protein VagC